MRRILHMSDLHLMSPSGLTHEDEIGDYTKSLLVDPGERQTRLTLLHDSLAALGRALAATGDQLDAIVITGDVALRGNPGSYLLLPDLLAQLGSALPAPMGSWSSRETTTCCEAAHRTAPSDMPTLLTRSMASGIDVLG